MRWLFCFLLLTGMHASWSQSIVSGGKLKPEQAIMDIRHYTVALTVDPSQRSINGYGIIELILTQPSHVLLLDLLNTFTISKVSVNGQPQVFTHRNDLVSIDMASALPAGRATVKIEYAGKPRVAVNAPWDGGFQWSKDGQGNDWVAITCQLEGAKIYFPCKDHPSDEPNEGADLMIRVPDSLVVAGPGLLQEVNKESGWKTYHWKTRYSINNYSILFNIGKFTLVRRSFQTVDGHTVPIECYLLEEHAGKGSHLLDVFERSIRMHEKYFGEYPWVKEKIGLCETPHLGMEHQSMNAYGNKFRYSTVGGVDFDGLMHHELGHEWWGNKVTGKDWADMWIQEGICTFGDHLFVRDAEGEAAYLKKMQATGRSLQHQKPVVQGAEVNSDAAYHGDIYGKGAFFMHTLRYVLGDEVFFPVLKKLATDSRYTYDNLVNTDDVEQFFSRESGQPLKALFDLYLRSTQKLQVKVKANMDQSYTISLLNYTGDLPMEVTGSGGSQRLKITNKGVVVKSNSLPLVDKDGYYIKEVVAE